jgi:hypothetical protein
MPRADDELLVTGYQLLEKLDFGGRAIAAEAGKTERFFRQILPKVRSPADDARGG